MDLELQNTALAVLACVFGVLMLLAMGRSGKFFRAFTLSAVSGLAALFAVHLLAQFTHADLAVNPVTLSMSAVAGIPGVVTLLVCRVLLL